MRSRFQFINAWQFDGVNDFVIVPDDPTLNFGTGDFSISFWLFRPIGAKNTLQRVFAKFSDVGSNRTGLDIVFFPAANSFRFVCFSNQNLFTHSGINIATPPSNQWLHYVFIKSTQNPNNWQLWQDGVLLSTTVSGPALSGSIDTAQDLFIGEHTPPIGQYFEGKIDETTIYDRALTPAEVAYLYNNGNGNAPSAAMLPNLVARWTFDTATGTLPNPILADVSGNGNNGTGRNFAVNPLTPH